MRSKIVTVSDGKADSDEKVYVLIGKDIYNGLMESYVEMLTILHRHYDRHDEEVAGAVDSAFDLLDYFRGDDDDEG